MWYEKCTYLVVFANGQIQDMSRKLRDAFNEMSPDNTHLAIFKFIISFEIMMKEFRIVLEFLKKAQANNVA